MSTPRPRIFCAHCGKRVRWRKRTDAKFDPPTTWHLPGVCSHCGTKGGTDEETGQPMSIAVRWEE